MPRRESGSRGRAGWRSGPEVVLILAAAIAPRAVGQPPAMPPAPVQVTRVAEGDVELRIDLVGETRARRRAVVASEVAGIVAEKLARAGDEVSGGQILARLDTTRRRIALAAAEARLAAAEAEVAELEAGSRTEELAMAEAELAEARALEDRARDFLDRKKRERAGGAANDDEVEAADAAHRAATARTGRMRAALDMARAGARSERRRMAEGRRDEAKADRDRIGADIARAEIRSPFHGVVVSERTEAGQWVSEGGAVLEILDLDEIEVWAGLPELNAGAVRPGDPVTVVLDALPSREFPCAVDALIPDAEARSRALPLRVVIRNERLPATEGGAAAFLLRSGLSARVSVQAGPPRRALLVPKDSVTNQGGRTFLCAVENGVIRFVLVETGAAMGDRIEVRGADVRAGMVVVSRGNERLRPGQPVSVKE